ncbi:hypothetical protein QFZ79_000540 [Arthrobacter sp. V4I6]|uniref:AbiJ-NTD4 domain-containing protein n=1 Tax=unclassified Arthrobacter TaxID=235627 RepID=UPI00278B6846|nr:MULTISPECIES: hypothetical protein [unclassified Arthrobacter]MDQ0822800.1 hypothetical protein [Arthrobacter sp. V1I7]MDQ0852429.1 hypothetical protein [Arthrobacter sp. V4I6]
MPRFSERNGYVEPRTIVQIDDLDNETRTQIWNVVYVLKMTSYDHYGPIEMNDTFAVGLWIEWNESLEYLQGTRGKSFLGTVKKTVVKGTMAEAFDLVEACIEAVGHPLPDLLNDVFTKYLVGYRVVNGEIIQVTETAEIEAIETALDVLQPYGGARKHLLNALSLLSNRQDPHYSNVVKESISAVEAVARHLTGEKTLGDALKKLEAKGVPTQRALVDGWLKLYGYTSAEGGIRHGSIELGEVDEALATYFLVTCSSMVGYLIKKAGSGA